MASATNSAAEIWIGWSVVSVLRFKRAPGGGPRRLTYRKSFGLNFVATEWLLKSRGPKKIGAPLAGRVCGRSGRVETDSAKAWSLGSSPR